MEAAYPALRPDSEYSGIGRPANATSPFLQSNEWNERFSALSPAALHGQRETPHVDLSLGAPTKKSAKKKLKFPKKTHASNLLKPHEKRRSFRLYPRPHRMDTPMNGKLRNR